MMHKSFRYFFKCHCTCILGKYQGKDITLNLTDCYLKYEGKQVVESIKPENEKKKSVPYPN